MSVTSPRESRVRKELTIRQTDMKAKVILKSWFADENITATEVVNLDENGGFAPSSLTESQIARLSNIFGDSIAAIFVYVDTTIYRL